MIKTVSEVRHWRSSKECLSQGLRSGLAHPQDSVVDVSLDEASQVDRYTWPLVPLQAGRCALLGSSLRGSARDSREGGRLLWRSSAIVWVPVLDTDFWRIMREIESRSSCARHEMPKANERGLREASPRPAGQDARNVRGLARTY